MFASCGYFRGITCPYFQSGLCERPYCHFRHVKEKQKDPYPTSISQSSSTVTSTEKVENITSAILPNDSYFHENVSKKIENNVEKKETELTKSTGEENDNEKKEVEYDSESNDAEFPLPNPSFQPVYNPTPKSQAIKRNPDDPLPEYCPTPITKLKRMKKPLSADLQYDPVSNYLYPISEKNDTTVIDEPVYVPIKRSLSNDSCDLPSKKQIRLDGEASKEEDNGFILGEEISNSDVEGDHDDAQFSDDDILMSRNNKCKKDNDCEEIFATKSYVRDNVREKGNDSEKVHEPKTVGLPKNLKKYDIISDIMKEDKSKSNEKNISHKRSETVKKVSSDKSKDTNHRHSDKENLKNQSKSSSKISSEKEVKNYKSDHSKERTKYDKEKSSSRSSSSHRESNKESSSGSYKSRNKHESSSSKSQSGSVSSSSSSSHKKPSTSVSTSKHSGDKSSSQKESENKKSSSSSSSSTKYGSSHKSSSSASSSHKSSSSSSNKPSSKSSSSSRSSTSHSSSHNKTVSTSNKHDNHKNDKTQRQSSSDKSSHKTKSSSGSSSSHRDKHNGEHKNKEKSSSSSDKEKDDKPSKRYSIEEIHADLFGSSEEEDNLSPPQEANEMSDSELLQYLDESDFSDADTYEECLKIFNETNSAKSKTPVKKDVRKRPETTSEENAPGKKRMAHESAAKVHKKPVENVKMHLSAAQVMHNRIIAMQKHALEAAAAKKALAEASTSGSSSMFGKKRVAHTTGHMNGKADDNKTLAITASKTEKRKAHAPTIKNIKRPTVPTEFGSKVPTAIRQRYLNLIIDECLKFIKDEESAFKRAQEEEHVAYGRSSSKNIYLRMAVNTIKRLRTEAESKVASPKKKIPNSQSHEATLGGSKAAKTSFTVKRSGKSQVFYGDFSGADLYKRLTKYITSEELLQANNFPRPCPESSSSAKFYVDKSIKDVTLKDYEKVCCRCGKRFIVYPDCEYGTKEQCSYHWGKAWKRRIAGSIETRYTCCSGELGSNGCAISKAHAYETNKYENTTGYMKTLPTSPPIDGNYGVYAMDCEMVYTTGGMELARVTVVGSDKQPVYESLVKPDYPVIDTNTRFSGIEDKDLENVTTTLRNVQAVLLSLFNDQTILLGHSLESDLIAVKLIHNTVVDTSLVFPHRLGPPYKRALRNLMSDHLQKIIQNDEGGHDSNEDASACLELMQWKLKEDAKKEHRRS
ncbi:RNA exonuclease 1 homolog [Patella vulgata]|uniref:RNA exonuclease 1 homolog n=1 Tax=Patella vulgata TaxID=6465 RepID=UPI00217F3C68|nr:RNA exonuclease 1 homolog [Patella vulgata]